jgi:Zn-dependent alcohol dehydrogenase
MSDLVLVQYHDSGRRREEAAMPQQVQAVVARAKGAPVEIATVIVPDPGPGEAVVAVRSCGVCHTDLHYRVALTDVEAAFARMRSGDVLRSVVVL